MNPQTRILISGASVAGPALAFWLARAGHQVTVVERMSEFRDGGQNIDVRGSGREVLRKMGLEQKVKQYNTGEQGMVFVDEHNEVAAEFEKDAFGGDGPTAELEILRGDLAKILFNETNTETNYIFGESISTLQDSGEAVDVTFESGREDVFDLVIVAEGIGSHTRQKLLGDIVEYEPYDLYMGYFTIPKGGGDGDQARWYNAPGGRGILLRPDNKGTTRAVLALQTKPCGYADLSQDEIINVMSEKFADAGWETPRVLEGMKSTDDFYFEEIRQVHCPTWSKGRVALLGDAAWAPGPVTGMGTTLAITGAYVLAGELLQSGDHTEAFTKYEKIMRPYVEQSQKVPKSGPKFLQPQTRFGIALEHFMLNLATKPGLRTLIKKVTSPNDEKVHLKNYEM
ncbi:FAD-dependent monooxygenase [Teredinibacter turnerae]|uniref:FAD-dependent monooxygenase n=1 Tax=Teredinibacter turnerae TaxID=2426 RepID=UPI000409E229|nr:FAD-dependent monooxygenase [Teredinibacter turnerae]